MSDVADDGWTGGRRSALARFMCLRDAQSSATGDVAHWPWGKQTSAELRGCCRGNRCPKRANADGPWAFGALQDRRSANQSVTMRWDPDPAPLKSSLQALLLGLRQRCCSIAQRPTAEVAMAATHEAGGEHTLAEPVSADAGMTLELNELAVVYESVLSSQSHPPSRFFFSFRLPRYLWRWQKRFGLAVVCVRLHRCSGSHHQSASTFINGFNHVVDAPADPGTTTTLTISTHRLASLAQSLRHVLHRDLPERQLRPFRH